MNKQAFDIGIVVPLQEEFRYVVEVAPQLETFSNQGTYFYRLDLGATSAVCCLVGQMGTLPALQATVRLLEFADVKLLVVLGLGGALDDEVAVGDVVIASEINEFQANSKAEAAGEGYVVRYSGRNWPLEFKIREAIGHFEFSGGDGFANWRARATSDYDSISLTDKDSVCSAPPVLHLGPIASGNVVAASNVFVAEVRKVNRKFIAIDMEAAGVAMAAAERIHPIPCLVVRGISDRANEGKKALDAHKGTWRRYSVRNATSLLRFLLGWDGFLAAATLVKSESPTTSEALTIELVKRLKSCLGGPWIVGVAFDIYSYGPRLVDGKNAVPTDLNRLRISDDRIGALLDAAGKEKEQLLLSGDTSRAADGFARLMKAFCDELRSESANSLLQDFDRVIVEIVCPDDPDNEVAALLLEADRLEEEVGPEAIVELLRERANANPQLRERYVDALANLKNWAEVISITTKVEYDQLSRRELEHGLFACATIGRLDSANAMAPHHNKFEDRAAVLFRRELSRQYPQIEFSSIGEKK